MNAACFVATTSEEAFLNFGMAALYDKWLQDMLDVQATPAAEFGDCSKKNPIYPDCNGTVTDTTPHVPGLYGNRCAPDECCEWLSFQAIQSAPRRAILGVRSSALDMSCRPVLRGP